jgi:integrase
MRVRSVGLRQALQRLRPGINPHGFRSSFRDWAAEQTAYPEIVAEMALGHQVGSAVERAYRRSDLFDRRRRLMADWANYCASPAAGGEVVPIRA